MEANTVSTLTPTPEQIREYRDIHECGLIEARKAVQTRLLLSALRDRTVPLEEILEVLIEEIKL